MDIRNRDKLISIIDNTIDAKGLTDYYFASQSVPAFRINGDVDFKKQDIHNYNISDENILELLNDLGAVADTDNIPIDFGVTYKNKRFRCNLDRRWQGLDLTIRILPSNIRGLDELGLPEFIYKMMDMESGLILVCGSTGSGKSTTLAALIDYANNKYSKKIVTLEDPIEYIIKEKKSLIHQREVTNRNNDGFPLFLKSALRQHPDIIVVGEIRDSNTMSLTLSASETGHLILSTLHTISVQQTFARISDMAHDDIRNNVLSVLSYTLRGIIVQKLIRNVDNKVRVICEICTVNDAISRLIRGGKFHQIPNQMMFSEGCITLNNFLISLVNNREITIEEAKKYSYLPEDL